MTADKNRVRVTLDDLEIQGLDHLSEKYGLTKSRVVAYLIRKECGFELNITKSGTPAVQYAWRFIDTYVNLTSEDPLYWEGEQNKALELLKTFTLVDPEEQTKEGRIHWILIQLALAYNQICVYKKEKCKIISERNERWKRLFG